MPTTLDIGDHPTGTPPTLSEKDQMLRVLGAFKQPNAMGPIAGILDTSLFWGAGNVGYSIAYAKDPLAVTTISVAYSNAVGELHLAGFTALAALGCGSNQLAALDVSSCTALGSLNCSRNHLTTLDVTGCTALTILSCTYNQLAVIDVSTCLSLSDLSCSYNQLTTFNATGSAALQSLSCAYNQLTAIDVTSCASLTNLTCYNNQLTTLDVTGCTDLVVLNCFNNLLTTLAVENLLGVLDANGQLNGYCDISGTGNAPASPACAPIISNLHYNKGWTVVTN